MPASADPEKLVLTLVYISTARTLITDAMCQDILASSRINNPVNGVTGLLVAGKKRFLQALEGPADEVHATYARIGADPRHFACVVLAERTANTRQFGNWAMGYNAGHDADDHADLEAIVTALVAPLDDPDLRAQFIGFAQLNARAA